MAIELHHLHPSKNGEVQMNRQMYNLIELHSGVKGICRYDRIEALKAAHELNKRHPNERYTICAV